MSPDQGPLSDPSGLGKMGIPDLRYLSCPRRRWWGHLSQGQGKEAPWLGSPLSSTDPSIFPLLSPSPLDSEDLMHSAFISPNTYQPHPPCCHCPNHPSWPGGRSGQQQRQDPTGIFSPSLGALAPVKRLRHSSFPSHYYPVEGLILQRS